MKTSSEGPTSSCRRRQQKAPPEDWEGHWCRKIRRASRIALQWKYISVWRQLWRGEGLGGGPCALYGAAQQNDAPYNERLSREPTPYPSFCGCGGPKKATAEPYSVIPSSARIWSAGPQVHRKTTALRPSADPHRSHLEDQV